MANEVRGTVAEHVALQRGTTYSGALVGEPGPPLLGLGSIEPGGGFRPNSYKTFGGACPPNLMVEPGGIYVALKGATKDGSMVGSVARLPRDMPPGRLTQDTARMDFRDPDPAVAGHVYWVLRTPEYRQYCAGRLTGSAAASFSRSDFLAYPIPRMTRATRALVQVFDAIEDKIELNRRTNETLKAIARTLFQSWFVDFDPVRAKAQGRDPELPRPIADLFPNRFDDSELGEIPAEWPVDDVYRIADVIYGAPFKSEFFNARRTGRPLIRIRDLATHDPEVFTPEVHPRGHVVRPGDLVVGMDGEFRAHLWHGAEAWLNQRVCSFVPKQGVPRAYVHYSVESRLAFFERSKTGTTVIHLGKADIDTFRILVPPGSVLTAFGRAVDAIDGRVVVGEQESRTLSAIRDALLPKLISGEMRVPETERILEAASV